MACRQCGQCCEMVVFDAPKPTGDDWRYWRLHHLTVRDNPKDPARVQIGFQNFCHWYNPLTQKCAHYEERPDICRKYECDKCKKDATAS